MSFSRTDCCALLDAIFTAILRIRKFINFDVFSKLTRALLKSDIQGEIKLCTADTGDGGGGALSKARLNRLGVA